MELLEKTKANKRKLCSACCESIEKAKQNRVKCAKI